MLQDEPHRLAVEPGVHQTRPMRIAADVGAGEGHQLEQLVAGEADALGTRYKITPNPAVPAGSESMTTF